jgi:hypothetical protein
LGYQEACQYLNVEPKSSASIPHTKSEWAPKAAKHIPSGTWQEKCQALTSWAEKQLWQTEAGKPVLAWLRTERGLSDQTIKSARLGWNPGALYRERVEWGLKPETSSKTGKPKRVWIPSGLVIPLVIDGSVLRIRIRRDNIGKADERYILITGSDTRPLVLSTGSFPAVVVESDLDALLIHQEAGDVVNTVALGNNTIRPDTITDGLLRQAELVLCSLDSDAAGAQQAWKFWRETYRAKRWPCIRGKDPGEMYGAGVDVRQWVIAGLPSPGTGDRLREIVRAFNSNDRSVAEYQELAQEGDKLCRQLPPATVELICFKGER